MIALTVTLWLPAMRYFGTDSLNQEAQQHKGSPLPTEPEQHETYLRDVATEILINYVYYRPETQVQKELPELEDVSQQHACKRFSCTFPECSKSYTTIGWLKKHLRDMHRVNIELPTSSSQSSSDDGIFSYASAFMKVALLYLDTVDCTGTQWTVTRWVMVIGCSET